MGLDFSLLRTDPAHPGVGVQRFNQQFWRANIDPTESYVTSPWAAPRRASRPGAAALPT